MLTSSCVVLVEKCLLLSAAKNPPFPSMCCVVCPLCRHTRKESAVCSAVVLWSVCCELCPCVSVVWRCPTQPCTSTSPGCRQAHPNVVYTQPSVPQPPEITMLHQLPAVCVATTRGHHNSIHWCVFIPNVLLSSVISASISKHLTRCNLFTRVGHVCSDEL